LEETQKALKELNQNLEIKVKERTNELTLSLEQQQKMQEQLVESEKMASLGNLVSGVAHEINTPLGVCITAASHVEMITIDIQQSFEQGELSKEILVDLFDQVIKGNKMITHNLKRSAKLVQNFKQVAVEKDVEDLRTIKLGNYFDMLVKSLSSQWRYTSVTVKTEFDHSIEITSYPNCFNANYY
jgi:C4-dicarboxylate-specific signal transduction histidine kinase